MDINELDLVKNKSNGKNNRNKVVLVMQARMGSTRLNGKVMRNLYGKTILEHDIERIRQAKLVDEIVIATTTKEQDDIIMEEAQRLGVKVFRGSEDHVLSRYYYAAKESGADTVVRVTSDCPLIDPYILDEVITFYKENEYDIVSNAGNVDIRTYPRGLDVEVFSFEKLSEAYQKAEEKYQQEHVTPYLYENDKVGYYNNDVNYSNFRWTLDTEEDWEMISVIYQNLYHGKHDFYFKEILEFMLQHPELEEINKHVEQKKVK
jgi:spore coat polysaccharide biosynthesis protein SpsF